MLKKFAFLQLVWIWIQTRSTPYIWLMCLKSLLVCDCLPPSFFFCNWFAGESGSVVLGSFVFTASRSWSLERACWDQLCWWECWQVYCFWEVLCGHRWKTIHIVDPETSVLGISPDTDSQICKIALFTRMLIPVLSIVEKTRHSLISQQ